MTDTGISTIEEAFAAAKLELGIGAAPENAGAPTPDPTGEATPIVPDQPVPNPQMQTLVDSLVEPPAPDDPNAVWAQEVEIGGQAVTIGELRNGYLRHADYTRKTQELADQRREFQAAEKFYQDFLANPEEFSKALGAKYGWWDTDASPVDDIEVPGVYTPEQFEQRVSQLVEERLQTDPRIEAAQIAEAEQLINQTFTELEKKLGVEISEPLRQSLLEEAEARNVFDLELLLRNRIYEFENRQRTSEELARSGASRPSSRGALGNVGEPEPVPTTVEEAWALAKAEQAFTR